MNSKLIGGILLIVGTTIGAGMLALPVATAALGFWGSTILLISCWSIMTLCAYLFLEVNLWLPPKTNLISMAGATLGMPGKLITWVTYMLLLYSIVSAYIAGGGDLFHYLLKMAGIDIPLSTASLLFTFLFGSIVYFGIQFVDYANRGLMLGKLGAFILLVLLVLPFVSSTNLAQGEFKNILSPTSASVTIVAFTCLMIIPSLRTYFNEDINMLRKAIFWGTLIPLICYIAWDLVIMGVVPLEGAKGLKQMVHSANSNSDLVSAVTGILQSEKVTFLTRFFTSICMATSFLSVSLSLTDFLSDGLRTPKRGVGKIIIFIVAFLPPILVVLCYPDAFIRGLKYAGLSCFILMVFLPPLMAWRGRYYCHLAMESTAYRVGGGKGLLAMLLLFASLLIGFGVEGVV